METVDVVVASYGPIEQWESLIARAVQSANNQELVRPTVVRQLHDPVGSDLSWVRNQAAMASSADWLIFLDADDELDPCYIEAMLHGAGDIRQPLTLGVHPDGHEDDYPVLIPPNPGGFLVGNHLVIGSMVRRSLFEKVGGFREGMKSLEDWDLFIRMRLAGGTVGEAAAIYRVHVRPASRNSPEGDHHQTYAEIQRRYSTQWQQLLTS
jgi:glycosyltransferase involved in cell wall biosynthesis